MSDHDKIYQNEVHCFAGVHFCLKRLPSSGAIVCCDDGNGLGVKANRATRSQSASTASCSSRRSRPFKR